MVNETVKQLARIAEKKVNFLEKNMLRYFILSMLAGLYVGFAIVLVFSIGAPFKEAGSPGVKALMGVSFGVALTLVIFAGSELFTGNNMTMAIGSLEGKIKWRQTFKLWSVCYLGNLAGSLLLALAMAGTGLIHKQPLNHFITDMAAMKMNTPLTELFIKGILCNILVCLATWTTTITKDDSAKLILIFWCLFAFIGASFEHSVANMTLFGMGLFTHHNPALVSWYGFARNLFSVTLGNIVGGAVFMGAAYWYVAQGEVEEKLNSY